MERKEDFHEEGIVMLRGGVRVAVNELKDMREAGPRLSTEEDLKRIIELLERVLQSSADLV